MQTQASLLGSELATDEGIFSIFIRHQIFFGLNQAQQVGYLYSNRKQP
jgi:hypothetical protein